MTTASSPKVVVVTGADGGIGLALITLFASQPNTIVYAGVLSTSPEDLRPGFLELVERSEGRVKVLVLKAADEEGNKAAAREVQGAHGHVDVVIANAGIGYTVDDIVNVPVAAFIDHFNVNTLGPLVLYQAFAELLAKKHGSKFIVMSSDVGSIGLITSYPSIIPAYSTSKAALNMLIRIVHAQSASTGLVAFPLHPGAVDTPMCIRLVAEPKVDPGMEEALKQAMISPETSATAVLEIVDRATRESHGGRFASYDGQDLPW